MHILGPIPITCETFARDFRQSARCCLSLIPIIERLSLARARLSTRRGYSRASQINRSRSERDARGGLKSTGIGRLSAHYANIQLAACPRYIAIVPFLRGPSMSSYTCAGGRATFPFLVVSFLRSYIRSPIFVWGILHKRNPARVEKIFNFFRDGWIGTLSRIRRKIYLFNFFL